MSECGNGSPVEILYPCGNRKCRKLTAKPIAAANDVRKTAHVQCSVCGWRGVRLCEEFFDGVTK